jgi:hypothetical protein
MPAQLFLRHNFHHTYSFEIRVKFDKSFFDDLPHRPMAPTAAMDGDNILLSFLLYGHLF